MKTPVLQVDAGGGLDSASAMGAASPVLFEPEHCPARGEVFHERFETRRAACWPQNARIIGVHQHNGARQRRRWPLTCDHGD